MKLHWNILALLLAVGIATPAAAQLCEGSAGDAQVAQALLMDTERLAQFRQKHQLDNAGICRMSVNQFLNRNFALDAPNPIILEETYRQQRLAEQRDEFGEIYALGLPGALLARERLLRSNAWVGVEVRALPLQGNAPVRAIRLCPTSTSSVPVAALDDLGLYLTTGQPLTQSVTLSGTVNSVGISGMTFNQIEEGNGNCDLISGENIYRGSANRTSYTVSPGTTDGTQRFFRQTSTGISELGAVAGRSYFRLGPLDFGANPDRLWIPARQPNDKADNLYTAKDGVVRASRSVDVMDRSGALAPCPFLDVIVVGSLRVVADACGQVFGFGTEQNVATTTILGTIHANYPIHEFRDNAQFWSPSIRLASIDNQDNTVTLLALANLETCVTGQRCTYEKRLYRCRNCLAMPGPSQIAGKQWELWSIFDQFDERYATHNVLKIYNGDIWVGGYDIWRKTTADGAFKRISDGEQAPFAGVGASAPTIYLPHGQRDMAFFAPIPAVATQQGLWQANADDTWTPYTAMPSMPATAVALKTMPARAGATAKIKLLAAGRGLGTFARNSGDTAWTTIAGGDGTAVTVLNNYLIGNFAHLNPFRKLLDDAPLSQYLPVDTTLRSGLPVDRLTPTEYAPPFIVTQMGGVSIALAGGSKIWAGLALDQANQGRWLEVAPKLSSCTGSDWLAATEYITALAWQESSGKLWIGTNTGRVAQAQPLGGPQQLCDQGANYHLVVTTTHSLTGRINRIACVGSDCYALKAGYGQIYQCLTGSSCRVCPSTSAVCQQPAYAVIGARDGNGIWLGTETGLYQIDSANQLKAVELSGLPSNIRINDIAKLDQNCYAFATVAGVYTLGCDQ